MKRIWLVVFLFSSSAYAQQAQPDVSLILSPQEQQVLIQYLDLAVKSCGLQCAPNAAALWQKIQAAKPVAPDK